MAYLLSLDLYKVVFFFELVLAECLFVFRFEKRSYFALRFILGIIVCATAIYFIPIIEYNAIVSSAIFFIVFAISVGFLCFCFKQSFVNILFCALISFTTQHIAYQFFNIVIMSTGLMSEPLGIYGSEITVNPNWMFIPDTLACYFIVYWSVFAIMNYSISNWNDLRVKSVPLLSLIFVVFVVDIVVNLIVVYLPYESWNLSYKITCSISSFICGMMTLWVQINLIEKKELKSELENIYHIYSQEQKQFASSQTNVDIINQKCHDLKYQIRAIAKNGAIQEDVIQEIEDTIKIYDTSFQTGNRTLDTILTEKSPIFRKNSINLTCLIDGSKLNFINAVDLYTLFGNAVDNALEAVIPLDEKDRVISLTSKQNHDVFSITMENYFSGELNFYDHLPKTTKGDDNYHGFGLKSIKKIVEKYDGDIMLLAENGVFTLNILFFLNSN